MVIGRDLLDLLHDSLVLQIIHPELLVVVLAGVELGRRIPDHLEVGLIFQHNF